MLVLLLIIKKPKLLLRPKQLLKEYNEPYITLNNEPPTKINAMNDQYQGIFQRNLKEILKKT